MILLTVEDVSKQYGPEPILDHVSLELRRGDRIGLVGPNGVGKTTLLSIIAGTLESDGGSVQLAGGVQVGLLEQHPQFDPDITVWEEAKRGLEPLIRLAQRAEEVAHEVAACQDDAQRMRLAEQFDRIQHELAQKDAYHIDHRIERVLTGLGFAQASFTQPAAKLSGGQQNRLILAQLLLAAPDVLLLDEPSNHLDLEATAWLEDYLSQSSQAMVIVSHDRYFLDKVTNGTWELFHSTIDAYTGNFSAYWRQKAERLEVQRRTFEKQQEFIAKTEDFIRRNNYGQKHQQAEDRKKKLARLERVTPPREITAPPMKFPPAERSGDIVLRVEGLSKSFAMPLFENFSLDIERGQRWGILGPNGSGKTTLLRCIVGDLESDAGRVQFGSGVKVAYFDQLLTGLDPEQPIVESVRPSHKEFVEQQRRDLLARFGLTGDEVFKLPSQLSGGQRTRTALARLAAMDANVLVFDEPTNHLDLWSRDALERALKQFNGTVLLVSHDRYLLNRVVDHLLVVENQRFRTIEGNYDTYLHLVSVGMAAGEKQLLNAPPQEKEKKSSSSSKTAPAAEPKTDKPAKRRRRFSYRKVEEIEAEILERETRIEELHALLAEPDVLRDGQRVKEIQASLEAEQQALPQLYEHYDEAVELN